MSTQYISALTEFAIGQKVLYANPITKVFRVDTVISISVSLNGVGQSLRYEIAGGDLVEEKRLCSMEYAYQPHEFIDKWAKEWGQIKEEKAEEGAK